MGYSPGTDDRAEVQPGHVICLPVTCHLVGVATQTPDSDLKTPPAQTHQEVTRGSLGRAGLRSWVLLIPGTASQASRPLVGLPWELPGLFEASWGARMAGTASHRSGVSSPHSGPLGG